MIAPKNLFAALDTRNKETIRRLAAERRAVFVYAFIRGSAAHVCAFSQPVGDVNAALLYGGFAAALAETEVLATPAQTFDEVLDAHNAAQGGEAQRRHIQARDHILPRLRKCLAAVIHPKKAAKVDLLTAFLEDLGFDDTDNAALYREVRAEFGIGELFAQGRSLVGVFPTVGALAYAIVDRLRAQGRVIESAPVGGGR